MSEDKNNRYQWIKGDQIGTVETLKERKTIDNIEYFIFESKRRIARDMIYSYMIDYNESGSVYIDSKMLDEQIHKQNIKSHDIVDSQNQIPQTKNKTQTQSQQFTLTDIINKQLEINCEYVTIDIEVPVLKKEFVKMLIDTYPFIVEDLSKILIDKYINKEKLEKTISEKIGTFYSKISGGNKIRPQVIDIVTEKLK